MSGSQQSSRGQNVGGNKVTIPNFLQPYLKQSEQGALGQETQAQGGLPSIEALYGDIPQQGVAGLTPQQQASISAYGGLNNGAANSYETAGLGTLGSYAGGTPGNDPASIAALQDFGQITSPQIAQNAALQGQGNSGAAIEGQAIGQSSMLAPFLENAESNQTGAANSLNTGGQAQNTQALNTLAAQLQAQGLSQQEAQQVANSIYGQHE